MNNQQMIESAKKMTKGFDYKVATRSAEFVDETMQLPRKIEFRAVEFTATDGTKRFIGEMFL